MGAQQHPDALERTARDVAAEWGLELGEPFTLSVIHTSRPPVTTLCSR
jgi:hypothetical protein